MAEDYIGTLNLGDPTNATNASDIDDKIVVVKTACKQSMPNVTGAITKSHTEINALPDVGDAETITGDWSFSGVPKFKSRNFKGVLAASISSAGAVTAQSNGSTISASRTATGRYTVTHNLGSTNYCAVATLHNSSWIRAILLSKNANTVDVVTINTSSDYADCDFEILLIPY